ncbi:MAG: SagB/ThcOx family dehydrogenase [Bacillota bacterium]
MERETPAGWQMQRVSSYHRGQSFPGRQGERPAPYREYPERLALVQLPQPVTTGGPGLWEVMRTRRTERSYRPDAITPVEVAQLVWAAQGITGNHLRLRTVPSAGALHPFELFLVVNRVTGLEPGLYHYHVPTASLEFLRPGELGDTLARAALDQDMMSRAALNVALAAVVRRAVWRYHERAWRYMYLDAGHIMQNLALAAAALGLGLCPIGAYYDGEVDHLFGLDGEEETIMYMASIGRRL